MIDAGHSSLEFIRDYYEAIANLDHAMYWPQQRQSNQDCSKHQRARGHGKKWPQQHEEPAYSQDEITQTEPTLKRRAEQRTEGVGSSSQREDHANESWMHMLSGSEHNHNEGTGWKDKIETAGNHGERSNNRLMPQPLQPLNHFTKQRT